MSSDEPLSPGQIERLYEAHGPRLARYVERSTGDSALAADIVQDVFMRLLRRPPQPRSEPEMRSLLFRMAYCRLVDGKRRDKRLLLWLRLERAKPVAELPPEGEALDGLRRLKPRDAAILWLAYVEEMSHAEIADVLAVGTPSVGVLLHRAKARLREEVARIVRRQETGHE